MVEMNDTQPAVKVRPAVLDDEAALLKVEKSAWDSSSGFPSLRDPDATKFFDVGYRRVEIHHVAEYDGEVVGYARLAPSSDRSESAHVLGIHGLAVAPWARRFGVATALMDGVEVEARRRGARKIALGVLGHNDKAMRLYQRCGYQIEGRLREEFYIDGAYVDDLVMAKFLT